MYRLIAASVIFGLLAALLASLNNLWLTTSGDLALLNAVKDKILAPDLKNSIQEIINVYKSRKPENPKLFFIAHALNVEMAENFACNLRGISGPSVQNDSVILALDKATETRLKAVWHPYNVVHLPYDDLVEELERLDSDYDITWAVRLLIAEKLVHEFDGMFCSSVIEAIWIRDFVSVTHFKKTRPNWELMTDTIGYWGPLQQIPDFGTFCIRPSASTRAVLSRLVHLVFDSSIHDRTGVRRLCSEKYANITCEWFRKNHISSTAYSLLPPVMRKVVSSIAFRLNPWPYQSVRLRSEAAVTQLKDWRMYFRNDSAEAPIKGCDVEVMKAIRPNMARVWGRPVELRLWLPYAIHHSVQYILKLIPLP